MFEIKNDVMATNDAIVENLKAYNDLTKNFYHDTVHKMIQYWFATKVKKIIEENTDIFSAFHYDFTYLLAEKNGISYWKVREISSGKTAVINSNKEIIIPFDYNYITNHLAENNEYIICYNNNGKTVFDFNGNVIKNTSDNNDLFNSLDQQRYIAAENIVNELKNINDENYSDLNNLIKSYGNILKVVKENTQKLENSSVPHSIFDYKYTLFFRNGSNKRYYHLKQKESNKIGLVNSKGELITSFIYDYIGGFDGESNFIHVQIGDKWGLLDCLGTPIVNPISEHSIFFYEGLAAIKQGDKYGYIDSCGNIVLPIIYDKADSFSNGRAKITLNDETFYINRNGERVEEC